MTRTLLAVLRLAIRSVPVQTGSRQRCGHVRSAQLIALTGIALTAIALFGGVWPQSAAGAEVFTVDVAYDSHDAEPGDGVALDEIGNTSLRAAIEEANANATVLADLIVFDLDPSAYSIELMRIQRRFHWTDSPSKS